MVKFDHVTMQPGHCKSLIYRCREILGLCM